MDNPEQEIRRYSRRGLILSAAATAAAFGAFKWLRAGDSDGLPAPLRRVLEFNEDVMERLYSPIRKSPEFAESSIQPLRVNGDIGLQSAIPDDWQLTIIGPEKPLVFSMAEIKKMPKYEMTTQLRCVEGWSRVNQWAGARFSEIVESYAPSTTFRYVYMETPDKEYFVGLDRASAMHSQTLLCYEMNHAPLTLEHGAPLRLAMPIKYGYKQLKRIGTIRLMDERPGDYWAQQGYDWYAGL